MSPPLPSLPHMTHSGHRSPFKAYLRFIRYSNCLKNDAWLWVELKKYMAYSKCMLCLVSIFAQIENVFILFLFTSNFMFPNPLSLFDIL